MIETLTTIPVTIESMLLGTNVSLIVALLVIAGMFISGTATGT